MTNGPFYVPVEEEARKIGSAYALERQRPAGFLEHLALGFGVPATLGETTRTYPARSFRETAGQILGEMLALAPIASAGAAGAGALAGRLMTGPAITRGLGLRALERTIGGAGAGAAIGLVAPGEESRLRAAAKYGLLGAGIEAGLAGIGARGIFRKVRNLSKAFDVAPEGAETLASARRRQWGFNWDLHAARENLSPVMQKMPYEAFRRAESEISAAPDKVRALEDIAGRLRERGVEPDVIAEFTSYLSRRLRVPLEPGTLGAYPVFEHVVPGEVAPVGKARESIKPKEPLEELPEELGRRPLTGPFKGKEAIIEARRRARQRPLQKPLAETFEVVEPPVEIADEPITILDRIKTPRGLGEIFEQEIEAVKRTPEFQQKFKVPATMGQMIDEAASMGYSAEELIKNWGTDNMPSPAQLFAAKAILEKGTDDLARLNKIARETGSYAARMKFAENFETLIQLVHMVSGGASKIGQSFGALSEFGQSRLFKLIGASKRNPYDFMEALPRGAESIDDLMHLFTQLEGPQFVPSTVGWLSKMKGLLDTGPLDTVIWSWSSGLVSGPYTQFANAISNSLILTWRNQVEMPIQAFLVEPMRVLAFGGPRKVLPGEVAASTYGLTQAFKEAGRTFAQIMKATPEELALLRGKYDVPYHGEWAEKIIGFPYRLLLAADEFFKFLAYRAEMHRLAYRHVVKEGISPQGGAASRRIADIVRDPEAALGAIGKAMHKRAIGVAEEVTFTKPLGRLGKRYLAGLKGHPWLRFLTPFVTAPVNIMKQGLERIPGVGLIKTAPELLRGAGPERATEILSRQLAGGLLGGSVFLLTMEGKITGGLPKNPAKRQAQLAAGFTPYSIYINGRYIPYERWEPFSTIIGTFADVAQFVMDEGENIDMETYSRMVGLLHIQFTRLFRNKTFMKGLADFLAAIQDPTVYAERQVESFVSSFIPAISAQMAGIADPVVREINSDTQDALRVFRDIQNAIISRTPFSPLLPPRVDVLGAPITRRNPIWGKPALAERDHVAKEILRLNVSIGKPPRAVGQAPRRKESVLNWTEYGQLLTERGFAVYNTLEKLMQSRTYLRASDEDRVKMIRRAIRRAGGLARRRFVGRLARERPGRFAPGEITPRAFMERLE